MFAESHCQNWEKFMLLGGVLLLLLQCIAMWFTKAKEQFSVLHVCVTACTEANEDKLQPQAATLNVLALTVGNMCICNSLCK